VYHAPPRSGLGLFRLEEDWRLIHYMWDLDKGEK
jgi:hypothetical protein